MADDERKRDFGARHIPHAAELFTGLLKLGAEKSTPADIELDSFAIVTVYPSRQVMDDAISHITDLRSEGAEKLGAELMDAYPRQKNVAIGVGAKHIDRSLGEFGHVTGAFSLKMGRSARPWWFAA